jgi:hypothetical protein
MLRIRTAHTIEAFMKHEQYEAVGKLIHGFQRHHGMVDRMLVLLGMTAAPETELGDKLVAIEARLDQFDDMPEVRQAIQAFAAQMRATGQLIERATTAQAPDGRAYAQQWTVLDSAAETAWARMMVANGQRRRDQLKNQAPPA